MQLKRRYSVSFSEIEDDLLEALAKRAKVSKAKILRQIIIGYLSNHFEDYRKSLGRKSDAKLPGSLDYDLYNGIKDLEATFKAETVERRDAPKAVVGVEYDVTRLREYQLGKASFSIKELQAIKRMLAGEEMDAEKAGMSAEEWREMMAVLNG